MPDEHCDCVDLTGMPDPNCEDCGGNGYRDGVSPKDVETARAEQAYDSAREST